MKRTLSFILLLAVVGVASAQLLWKISSPRLQQPSYLFATHDRVDPSFLEKVPGVFKYFEQTKTVVSEFVSEDFDGLSAIKEVAFLPAGKTLHNYLSDEDYNLITKTMRQDHNMDFDNLIYLQPHFVLTLYNEQVARKLSGNQTDPFLDAWFQWYGSENDHSVVGLESLNDYLKRLIGTETLENQTKLLVKTFSEKDKFMAAFQKSIADYKKGDLAALAEDNFTNNKKVLNQLRLTKLELFLSESSCFVVLDAAYFAGENGLLKMLEEAGYKVKAIDISH